MDYENKVNKYMKNNMRLILKPIFLFYIMLQSVAMLSEAPNGMTYQGRYRENGVFISGTRAFLFKISNNDGASVYWRSPIVNLSIEKGLFSYTLLCSTGINWSDTQPFIEVRVGPAGSAEGQLTVLAPREQLMGAAYSYFASTTTYSQKTGAGTANNYPAKFVAADQVGNSSTIYDNGSVAIGNASPANKLDVEGSCAIGATYSGTSAAPNNGLIVEGNTGIGTSSPQNKLDIEGAVAVGATYSGTSAAPSNGLIVEGKVGIGMTNPSATLDIKTGSGNTYSLKLSSNNGTELMSVTQSGTLSGYGILPIGVIMAWHKSLTGVPALPSGWVECSGQVLSDAASVYNGQTIPNLNSQVYAGSRGRYIRGGTTSGSTNASTRYSGNGTQYTGVNTANYYGGNILGYFYDTENGTKNSYSSVDNLGYPYIQVAAMTVVWIMRVK